ncbi:response regulator [bacterium]|nr:response regulator [bacterium]
MDYLSKLFDLSDFPARWRCGNWTAFEGWLHIGSDLAIWGAYMAIPFTIAHFLRRRPEVQFPTIFWLFAAFIFSCGTTHLIEASIFYYPIYRISGVAKALTAILSWATVLALVRVTPEALKLPLLKQVNDELTREVAQRKKAQGALAESERLFRLLANGAPMLAWLTDREGRTLFRNSRKEAMRTKLQQPDDAPWWDLIHPSDLAACRKAVEESTGGDTGVTFDCRFLAEPGDYRWMMLSCVPYVDARGELQGMVFIAIDISDRKKAEEDLRKAEVLQRTLVNATSEIVWHVSGDGTMEDTDSWCRGTGMSPSAAKGHGWRSAVHPDFADAFSFLDDPTVSAVTRVERELKLVGSEWSVRDFQLRAIPILSPDGQLREWVGTLSDLSELRRAERDRAAIQQQLLHVQKLESLGVMAGGVAHDFNNLLVGIVGSASYLKTQMPPGDPNIEWVEQIEESGRCAAGITAQMLSFSGRQQGKPSLIKLSTSVHRVLGLATFGKHKGIRFVEEHAQEQPHVLMDPSQFDQVVLNLVTNAAEAVSQQGGTVIVRTSVIALTSEELARTWVADRLPGGRYVVLEVIDNGVGMSPEVLAKVFDPFFTTKFTGRGLGLAAVLGIVRGHRGALRIQSAPGVGSTFTIYLPAVDGPVSVGTPVPVVPTETSEREESSLVLVVDDEPLVRRVAAAILSRAKYKVHEAENGAEALVKLRQGIDGRPYTHLVLDLTMPGLGGVEVLEVVAVEFPGLPVILSSGHHEQDRVPERLRMSPNVRFLQKPYGSDELLRSLREWKK